MKEAKPWAGLEDVLASPCCTGSLHATPGSLRCADCGRVYPQERADCVDLLPPDPRGANGGWLARQRQMEAWYRDMVTTDWARACLTRDYEPFRELLADYRGTVLDLGGGAGITRHYLRSAGRYIVVDPSLLWLEPDWGGLADAFPCLSSRPPYVRGVGEHLPFRSGCFDTVLAFWALNHASDGRRVFREVARTLVPGGRFLVVLEDMEPRWREVPGRASRPAARAQLLVRKAVAALPGRNWKVQSDHVAIREADLATWSDGMFTVSRRAWVGDYLTFEYMSRKDAER
jgi:SAM-dependent methyltransferase